MEIDYKKISRMTNMELLEYLEHINENDLQDVLEFVLFNLESKRITRKVDKNTFDFISNIFCNKKIIKNRGFLSWVIDFENSSLDFSEIKITNRIKLVKEIISLSKFYEVSVVCEIGRFIVRCLLINKIERLEYIDFIKKNLFLLKNDQNSINLVYFSLLDYQNSMELTVYEKKNIIYFLKQVSQLFPPPVGMSPRVC